MEVFVRERKEFHIYHGTTRLSRIPHKTAGEIPGNALMYFVFILQYTYMEQTQRYMR